MASAKAKFPLQGARQAGFARVSGSTNVTLAQPLGGRLTGSRPSPGYIGSSLLPDRVPIVSPCAERVPAPANAF